jgi:putative SOS response-associated peptidase YedK
VCLRYALSVDDPKQVSRRFGLDPASMPAEIMPRYNIAPTQEVPVVFNDAPATLSFARWGMPANWSGARHPLFNARAESIDRKPSFRKDFELRRCLMLADSFYEWKHPTKRPFRVYLKDGGMFAFAAIYAKEGDGLGNPEEAPVRTCCMITTAANSLVAQIHNRMPVILKEGTEKAWLEGGLDEAKALLMPYNAADMDMFEVSMKVNSAKNDSRDLLDKKTAKGTLGEWMG